MPARCSQRHTGKITWSAGLRGYTGLSIEPISVKQVSAYVRSSSKNQSGEVRQKNRKWLGSQPQCAIYWTNGTTAPADQTKQAGGKSGMRARCANVGGQTVSPCQRKARWGKKNKSEWGGAMSRVMSGGGECMRARAHKIQSSGGGATTVKTNNTWGSNIGSCDGGKGVKTKTVNPKQRSEMGIKPAKDIKRK